MYYIMNQNLDVAGVASVEDLPESMDGLEWITGKTAQDVPEDLILNLAKASGDYRGDIIDGLITLYSDELKDALIAYGVDNIEYYPVRLRDQTDDSLENGYWLTNIIGLLECVDRSKSKIVPYPSGVGEELFSFEVDIEKTRGAPIFRLAEAPTLVLVTEKLVDHLIESGVVGVNFTETSEYNGYR